MLMFTSFHLKSQFELFIPLIMVSWHHSIRKVDLGVFQLDILVMSNMEWFSAMNGGQ